MTRTLLALAALTTLAACGDSEESYELAPSAGASVDASTGTSTNTSTDAATDPPPAAPMDLSTGTFADPTAPAAATPPGGTTPAPARPIGTIPDAVPGAIPDAGSPADLPDGMDDAAVFADPATPTAPPTLSADNHVAVVAALLDVYRGAAWRERLLGVAARAEPLGTGFADLATGVTPDAPVLDAACDNGGTARFELVEGAERGWDTTFDGCQDGADVLDGRIRRTAPDGGPTTALEAVRFGVEGADGAVSFDGRVRWMPGTASPSGRTERAWSARGASFADTAAAGPILRDADYRYASVENAAGNVVRAELDGGFTMGSPATGGAEIVVETPEALRFRDRTNTPAARGDAWTFEAGSLRAVAADGSALLLQPANGDRDTVDVTITGGGNATVTLVEPWATWRENMRLMP